MKTYKFVSFYNFFSLFSIDFVVSILSKHLSISVSYLFISVSYFFSPFFISRFQINQLFTYFWIYFLIKLALLLPISNRTVTYAENSLIMHKGMYCMNLACCETDWETYGNWVVRIINWNVMKVAECEISMWQIKLNIHWFIWLRLHGLKLSKLHVQIRFIQLNNLLIDCSKEIVWILEKKAIEKK